MSAGDYRSYEYAGQVEQALCFGMGHDRRILILPPLFDEMNRLRRMLVQAMRALDRLGTGSILADLPGCNESARALHDQDLISWRSAVTAMATIFDATHVAAIRGGTLIDDGVAHLPHWRLAPVKGQSILKTMIRTRIAGAKEEGLALTEAVILDQAKVGPVALAGNLLSSAMIAQLTDAVPAPLDDCLERKLGADLEGSTLWLRAEPQDDPVMSESIASDLDQWSRTCAA